MFYDTTKADWKLFQEKLPNWQENFMKKLNDEYISNYYLDQNMILKNFGN